jgi:hypothetical protein
MKRHLTVLAILLVCTGCKERSIVETSMNAIQLPTLSVHEDPDDKSILIASVSNPSGSELTIPGFDGDLISGSCWYQGDKMISDPECGTGFWESVIKIPAGQTRDLRLPLPARVHRGERFTVAVVYRGLGSPAGGEGRKNGSPEKGTPDVSLNCRQMEVEVSLPDQ